MSNPVGPVCHIPPTNTPGNPSPQSLPGIPSPAQPTLQSLTQTVNQLRQIILVLTGQQGAQGAQGAAGKNAGPQDFTQQSIKTTTTKIYQNNDPSTGNYVEVQTIQSLVMGNKSGGTWTYNAAPPSGG